MTLCRKTVAETHILKRVRAEGRAETFFELEGYRRMPRRIRDATVK